MRNLFNGTRLNSEPERIGRPFDSKSGKISMPIHRLMNTSSIIYTRLGQLIMNILTFTEARASLKKVMDDVCKDHVPTVITRVNGEHVVMLSLDDFNSIEETLYLLGSANNASRLMESIAQFKAGKSRPRELIHNEKQEEQQQTTSKIRRNFMD